MQDRPGADQRPEPNTCVELYFWNGPAPASRLATLTAAHYPLTVADTEIVFAVVESPEGGFEARALGASIFTEADTLDDLRTAVRDAVRCHFDEGDRPQLIRLHLVRDEIIAA